MMRNMKQYSQTGRMKSRMIRYQLRENAASQVICSSGICHCRKQTKMISSLYSVQGHMGILWRIIIIGSRVHRSYLWKMDMISSSSNGNRMKICSEWIYHYQSKRIFDRQINPHWTYSCGNEDKSLQLRLISGISFCSECMVR